METSHANVSVGLGFSKLIAMSWFGTLPFGVKAATTALNQTLLA